MILFIEEVDVITEEEILYGVIQGAGNGRVEWNGRSVRDHQNFTVRRQNETRGSRGVPSSGR